MRLVNCGILALEKLSVIKNISLFTLIHLAKDNGLNLFVCKVDVKDLALVQRPAIFHAENHFVLVKNGKAVPELKYSGYVLTQKPLGRPVPYSEARTINGEKGGGSILGPILIGIASIINPFLGAAVGAAYGAHTTSGGALGGGDEKKYKGQFWQIPVQAASGFFSGSSPLAAAGIQAAGEIPNAVKTGDYFAPLMAGAKQYGISSGVNLFNAGFQNAPVASSFLQKAGSGFKNIWSGAIQPGGAAGSLASKVIPGSSTNAGGFGLKGALSDSLGNLTGGVGAGFGGGVSGLASAASAAAPNLSTGFGYIGGPSSASGFNLSKIPGLKDVLGVLGGSGGEGGGNLLSQIAGSVATAPFKPSFNFDPAGEFKTIQTYLGTNAYKPVGQAELNKYVSTPLADLSKEFSFNNVSVIDSINKSFDKQKQNIITQAAGLGQNVVNSSDVQKQLADLEAERTKQITLANEDLANLNLQNAIQAKQFALSQQFNNNVYDDKLAMELAALIGQDQQLDYSIKNNDYQTFQQIIAKILTLGFK